MINELLYAFFLIFIAEMGDKTQILAMAFSAKYPLKKVLAGVFIGSLLNHGLAVLMGAYLTHLLPIETIGFIAALAFIAFGLWSLKVDKDEDDDTNKKSNYGAVLTVASAFFIGELGDKTQLTAIALATRGRYPLFILMGTVLGMVLTSSIGVLIGKRLGKRIPEMTMKLISSGIFILFGLMSLREKAPEWFLSNNIRIPFIILLTAVLALMISNLRKHALQETSLKKAAAQLYANTIRIKESLQNICDISTCDECLKEQCTISQLKGNLNEALAKENFEADTDWNIPICSFYSNNAKALKESLKTTISTCLECSNHKNNCVGNQTRITLERLCFGYPIKYDGVKENYYKEIKNIDPSFFDNYH